MINALVTFHVESGKVREFESIHRKLVQVMGGQDGCIEIKVHRSVRDPLEYMVYGTWENKEAWERAHRAREFKPLFSSLPIKNHPLSSGCFYLPAYDGKGMKAETNSPSAKRKRR